MPQGDIVSQYKIEWITDTIAAGCATLSYDDLESINDQGITTIVNLCGEFFDLHEIQLKKGFDVLYFPIFDECAPDMVALESALEWVDEKIQDGKKVLVHCRFGMGRTGMFVFAHLLRQGNSLKTITKKYRKFRANPSAYCQWQLLRQYEKGLAKKAGK